VPDGWSADPYGINKSYGGTETFVMFYYITTASRDPGPFVRIE
jgi:hypothetical protein